MSGTTTATISRGKTSALLIERKLGQSVVSQRANDGYINSTELSKAHYQATGKRREPNDWQKLKRTQETLKHLSLETGIPVSKIIQITKGRGDRAEQATWLHPFLAVRFGIWLSDEFGYKIERWVHDSLTIQATLPKDYIPGYHQLMDTSKLRAEIAPEGSSLTTKISCMNLNKLINSSFGIKAGTRHEQPHHIRSMISTAQYIAEKAMQSNIDAGGDYKTCYAAAKLAVGQFVDSQKQLLLH